MSNHEKSTDELLNEIKRTKEIEKFLKSNEGEFNTKPVSEILGDIISSRGLKKSEVVARSGLNRIYTYQILQGKRVPSRDKLLALCFGLKLALDETNDVLQQMGFSRLYARNKRDSIVIFALENGKSIFAVNEMLFENNFEILTA